MQRILLGIMVICLGFGCSKSKAQDPNADKEGVTSACAIEDRQNAFAGCGLLYQKENDREAQCGGGTGTFKLVFNSADSCPTLIRGQEIFIGCGFAYIVESDRQTQCGQNNGKKKWIPTS